MTKTESMLVAPSSPTTPDQTPAPEALAFDGRELQRREQLIARIATEYGEMAGLSLTQGQARRLFDVEADRFERILAELVARGTVRVNADGLLVRN